jgi:hypothetical protein
MSFTFSQLYPRDGTVKEEQKVDIPFEHHGPNVDGFR